MTTVNYGLEQAKADFKSACKYVEAGVSVEENMGKSIDALSNYKHAIRILEKSLNTSVMKNASSAVMIDLRSKMIKYRSMCLERIAILTEKPMPEKKVSSKHVNPVTIPAASSSKAPKLGRKSPRQAMSKETAKTTAYEKLKNYDKALVTKILDDVVTECLEVTFDDVAGNENAKEQLREVVIYPALRPELFTGLRTPARGILLFGPPGNGKTMLAKAVANESQCVFLNISAASILSKWVGDSEKFVKVLFAVARALAPAIIFIDEIDALLLARKDDGSGNHVSRRVLTQFLSELDGVKSGEERILVLGATNRPQELDEAALRRFPKRIIIPMPDAESRTILLTRLLSKHSNTSLSASDINKVARLTENYSASDLTQLAMDAALGPIRELKPGQLTSIPASAVRPIKLKDFENSLQRIRPSLNPKYFQTLQEWNDKFGDSTSTASANETKNSGGLEKKFDTLISFFK